MALRESNTQPWERDYRNGVGKETPRCRGGQMRQRDLVMRYGTASRCDFTAGERFVGYFASMGCSFDMISLESGSTRV